MRLRTGILAPLAFCSIATIVACSSSSTPSYAPGPVPTQGPTGRPTLTPTAKPTATPTLAPTPSPSPTSTGVAFSCNATPNALPGTYTQLTTFGNVSGTTYTQSANTNAGSWNAIAYAAGTPSPSPTPTITPSPTASPSPTATPTPVTYIAYVGTYQANPFTVLGSGNPIPVSATSGCVLVLTTQNGSPIGPNGNTVGLADPVFAPTVTTLDETLLASGSITSFTITNLTPGTTATGSGVFTLDATAGGATGTVTIQTSQVLTFDRVRRLTTQLGAQRAVLRSAPLRY